jgi:hypothetical protein
MGVGESLTTQSRAGCQVYLADFVASLEVLAAIEALAPQSPVQSVEGEGATQGHQSTGNALSEAPGRNGRDGEKA